LGLFGSALLYGDGIITPAISVLSAVEGLEISTPLFKPYVIPIALVVLCLLFISQRYGTDKIGKAFGPIILIWFITLAVLGISGISHNPSVLKGLSPIYGIYFFIENGWHGFLALGAVFLVATGGEALYADIGHFGRKPIILAWFFVVLPSLVLNYFGQGALLLKSPEASHNPFYLLAPSWATMPLVFLSTMAAIIASQALISGTYSLTHQAIQLGYLPRQRITHTSSHEIGQIYVPFINWAMLIGTVTLVIVFGSSSRLAAAYGLAVTATMIITTILIYYVARYLWNWKPWIALSITAGLLIVDLSFFFANLIKLFEGGYVPLVIAIFIFVSMTTWRRGRYILGQRLKEKALRVDTFIEQLRVDEVHRVPGTAVFMTSVPDGTPPSLVHNVRHNHIVHSQTVLLTVITESIPYVNVEDQIEVKEVHPGMYSALIRYGFMEIPDVPSCLGRGLKKFFPFIAGDMTYFLGRESLIPTNRPGMARWREHLFSFMTKNSQKATDFFKLPADQVFEIGIVVEL